MQPLTKASGTCQDGRKAGRAKGTPPASSKIIVQMTAVLGTTDLIRHCPHSSMLLNYMPGTECAQARFKIHRRNTVKLNGFSPYSGSPAVFGGTVRLEDSDGMMSTLTPALSPVRGSAATASSSMEFFAASDYATSAAERLIQFGGFFALPLLGGLSLRTLLITLYLYINRLCILWRDA